LTTGNFARVSYDDSSTLNLEDLIVESSSLLELRTAVVSGDTQVINGATLTHPITTTTELKTLNLTTDTLMVDNTSFINVANRGYRNLYTAGVDGTPTTTGASTEKCGGSHGGSGGSSDFGTCTQGSIYDSITEPIYPGGGAGNWSGTAAGGGAIKINAITSMTIDGVINANGQSGGTGAAGGSVWLISGGDLTGSGSITAKGGSASATNIGSGGGGRIALEYDGTLGLSLSNIDAASGTNTSSTAGHLNGGAGTIYVEGPTHADGQGDLYVIDNGIMSNYVTTIHGHGTSFGTFTTGNFARVSYDDVLSLNLTGLTVDTSSLLELRTVVVSGDTQVINAGLLTHPVTTTTELKTLNLTTDTLTVDVNSFVNVNNRGYPNAYTADIDGVPTTTGGSTIGCGGSHGGIGSSGGGTPCAQGDVFDSLTEPIYPGGGGGEYNTTTSAGGGAIKVVASSISVEGAITANGGFGGATKTGGAGGSVWLISSGNISGAGSITAIGGPGTATNVGSGGGGRISIEYGGTLGVPLANISASSTLNTSSTAGNLNASAGSIYIKPSASSGNVIFNNNGINSNYVTSLFVSGAETSYDFQDFTVSGSAKLNVSSPGICDPALVIRGVIDVTGGTLNKLLTDPYGIHCMDRLHTYDYSAVTKNGGAHALSFTQPDINSYDFFKRFTDTASGRLAFALHSDLNYDNTNIDLAGLDYDLNTSKTLLNVGAIVDSTNLADAHTLYVPNVNDGDGVRICPNATSLSSITAGCSGVVRFEAGEVDGVTTKTVGSSTVVSVQLVNAADDGGALAGDSTDLYKIVGVKDSGAEALLNTEIQLAGTNVDTSIETTVDLTSEVLTGGSPGFPTNSIGAYEWHRDPDGTGPLETEHFMVLNMPGSAGFQDFSGEGNNGTAVNGVAYHSTAADCKVGGCVNFDGINDRIQVAHDPILNPGSITISLWLYLETDPDCDANNNWREILFKSTNNAGQTTNGYTLLLEQSRSVTWRTGNGAQNLWTTPAVVPIQSWTHIVVTHDSVRGVKKVYQDGVYLGSVSVSNNPLVSNTVNLQIGNATGTVACPNGAGAFPGKMDEIQIYPRALSDEQIAHLYDLNNQNLGAPQDLLAEETRVNDRFDVTVHLVGDAGDVDASLLSNFVDVTYPALNPQLNAGSATVREFELIESTLTGLNEEVRAVYQWKVDPDSAGALPQEDFPVVLNMPFNYEDGSTVTVQKDFTTPANDGTRINAVYSTSPSLCQVGGCMVFDGVDDYISIPDDASLDLDDSFTISAWINPDDYGSFNQIVDKRVGGVSDPVNYHLRMVQTSGQLVFSVGDGVNTPILTSTEVIPVTTWTHVMAVRDKANALLKIYINGRLAGSMTDTTVGGSIVNTSNVFIGARSPDIANDFDGKIDEVMIFSKVLSADEMSRLYSDGLNGYHGPTSIEGTITSVGEVWDLEVVPLSRYTLPGGAQIANTTTVQSFPVSIQLEGGALSVTSDEPINSSVTGFGSDMIGAYRWTNDRGAGPEGLMLVNMPFNRGNYQKDFSGNSHHGASVSATYDANPANCLVGGCLNFDGIDDHLLIQNNLPIGGGNEFTTSVWLKTSSGASQVILSKYTAGNQWNLQIGRLTPGKISTFLADGVDVCEATSTMSVDDDVWHHVVAVRDVALSQVRLYIDGALEASASTTLCGNSGTPIKFTSIGAGDGGADGSIDAGFYEGRLDELMIFDDVLTETEIESYCDAYDVFDNDCSNGITTSSEVPTIIPAFMTSSTDQWSLEVYPITDAGNFGSYYLSSNSVTVDFSTITVDLAGSNTTLTEIEDLESSVIGALDDDTLVYQWTHDNDGVEGGFSPENLMRLNMPFNGGTIQTDFSGEEGDGAKVNGEFYDVNCQVGGCITLNGTNQYVDILDSVAGGHAFTDLGNNNDYTISAWIKTSAAANASETAWRPERVIVDLRQETATSTKVPFSFGIEDTFLALGRTSNYTTTDERLLGTIAVNDGNWHHVVAIVHGNVVDFYVDGVLDVQRTFTLATGNTSVGSVVSNMQIGVGSTDTGLKNVNLFLGSLDEVQIYPRALTQRQVQQLYADGLAGNGGPSMIVANETSIDQQWDLEVFRVADLGAVETVSTASGNTVGIVVVPLTVELEDGVITQMPLSSLEDIDATVTGMITDAHGAYRWTFDSDGAGPTVEENFASINVPFNNDLTQIDFSGQNHHGTMNNGAVYDPIAANCKVGGCMSFDGVNDYVSIPDSADLDFGLSDSFTASIWFKTSVSINKRIFGRQSVAGQNGIYYMGINDTGTVYVALRDTNAVSTVATSTETYNDGNWHHAVMVRDTLADQLRLYVDNQLEASITDASTGTFVAAIPLYLGAHTAAGFTDNFLGHLDEFQLYPRALSVAQIGQLYADGNAGLGGPTVIHTEELVFGETWNLQVAPVSFIGDSGTALPSANTITIIGEAIDLELNDTVTELQNVISSFVVTSPPTSTVGYQWNVNGSPLMALNIPFNTGSSLKDISGNSNNGSVQNGAVFTTSGCQVGGCMSFDGGNDFVLLPSSMRLNSDNDFTISAWVNKTSQSNDGTYDDDIIFGQSDGASGSDFPLINLGVNAGGGIRFQIRGTANPVINLDVPGNISDGNWHHVVSTWEAESDTVNIYLDGVFQQSLSGSLSGNTSSNDWVGLGGKFDDLIEVRHLYMGLMDEVQIYPRALSEEQISVLYNDGTNGTATDRGGPTEIVPEEHTVGEVWQLNAFEFTSTGLVGSAIDVGSVTIQNAAATTLDIANLSGTQSGTSVPMSFTCTNSDSELRDVRVEFSIDGGAGYSDATITNVSVGTLNGSVIEQIPCNNSLASTITFDWNSVADDVARGVSLEPDIRIRVTVTNLVAAPSDFTTDFTVDNRPEIALNGGTLFIDEDTDVTSSVTNTYSDTAAYQWTVSGSDLTVLNMPFNAGSTQNDFSLNAHVGTTQNGAVYVSSGQVGGAISLDGVNDFVSIPDHASLNPSGPYTVSLWFQQTSDAICNGVNNNLAPLGKVTLDTSGYMVYQACTNNSWTFFQYGLTPNSISFNSPNALGVWKHFVAVYDGDSLLTYVDGVLSNSIAVTGIPSQSTNPLQIGKYTSNNQFFPGLVDEAQIYSRALSASQISQLYSEGFAGGGGPTMIESVETSAGEIWDLSVSLISLDGTVFSAVSSANTVTITEEISSENFTLSDPTRENQNLVSNMSPNPATSTIGYQWTIDPAGSNTPLMSLNMPFNSGSAQIDMSGNANDGTTQNGSLFTNAGCQVGGCMSFDGVDDYLLVPDSDSLESPEYTMSVWVKIDSQPGTDELWGILNKGTNDGNWDINGYTLDYRDISGVKTLSVYHVDVSNTYEQLLTSQTLTIGQWHHLVGTYDGTAIRLYMDGVEIDDLATASGPDYVGDAQTLKIGAAQLQAGYTGFFSGQMDEVQVLPRALSAAQIAQLYTDGTNINVTDRGGPTAIVFEEHVLGETWRLDVFEITAPGVIGPELFVDEVTITELAATTLDIATLVGTQEATFELSFTCTNIDSQVRDILVEFSTNSSTGPFSSATISNVSNGVINGSIIEGVSCNNGTPSTTTFDWDTVSDGVGREALESDVRIRITAQVVSSSTDQTDDFTVDNRPVVNLNGGVSGTVEISGDTDITSAVTNLYGDIAAYQWKVDPDGAGVLPEENLMALNLPMDEESDGVSDFSGEGNDGSSQNGAAYVSDPADCQVGGCMSFDGVDDMIEVPHDPSLNFSASDAFSIELWIKTSAITSQTFVSKFTSGVGTPGYLLQMTSDGKIVWDIQDTGFSNVVGSENVADNTFHHIVAVRDVQSDQLQIYVDGILDASATDTTTGTLSNTRNLYVGRRDASLGIVEPFNGTIDELRIYRRALTFDQIALLYADGNAGVGGPTIIHADETLMSEVWDLTVTPITLSGVLRTSQDSVNTVTIADVTPPTGTISYDGGEGAGADFMISIEGGNSITLTGTATDVGTGNSDISLVEVSINGGTNWNIATDTGGGTPWSTWSYNATLADGLNEVRIRVTDEFNNVQTIADNTITTDGTDGAQDITYLFLSIDSIDNYVFGPVTPNTIFTDDRTVNIRTNSQTGYQIQVRKQNADPETTMKSLSNTLFPDLADWMSSGNGNAEVWANLSTKGLGFRLKATSHPEAYNSNYWGADDAAPNAKFGGFPDEFETIVNDQNAKSSAEVPYSSVLQLQLEAPIDIPADTYSGTIEVNTIVNP